MDVYESELTRKIKDLYRDAEKEDQHFEPESKFTMEDITPEEREEIEQYYKEKNAHKPVIRKRWKWSFVGLMLVKFIIFLFFFVVLTGIFWFMVPFSINTSVTIFQALALTVSVMFIKFWWNFKLE